MSLVQKLLAHIGRDAVAHAQEAIQDGVFDYAIQDVIVQTVREGKDDGLSRVGFILKIAVEIIDRSSPKLPFPKARDMAAEVYFQFRRDNQMVRFGDPDWDWSGAGARELAHEYEIQYWEPLP